MNFFELQKWIDNELPTSIFECLIGMSCTVDIHSRIPAVRKTKTWRLKIDVGSLETGHCHSELDVDGLFSRSVCRISENSLPCSPFPIDRILEFLKITPNRVQKVKKIIPKFPYIVQL